MNKQEFYRLRSKFRLLKRVYDDMDYQPEISFIINKLSKKIIDGSLLQLIIAEPAAPDTRTWVQKHKQKAIIWHQVSSGDSDVLKFVRVTP